LDTGQKRAEANLVQKQLSAIRRSRQWVLNKHTEKWMVKGGDAGNTERKGERRRGKIRQEI
jgi:hypothetical protein